MTQHVNIEEFHPDQLQPGTKQRLYLDAFATPATTVTLPLLAVRGANPGPTLMMVAGVHGDEFEGPAAIYRLYDELDPTALQGTVLAIPICNVFAYEGLGRNSPLHVDGLNMARVFPGDRFAEPTRRLAACLMNLPRRLLGPDDLLVDFHSSGTRYRYLPMIAFPKLDTPASARSEEAARVFGIDLIFAMPIEPFGRFNSQTVLHGIPTVATETTGQGGQRPEDVQQFLAGLRRLLVWQKMHGGIQPERSLVPLSHLEHIYVEESGFFIPEADVELGHVAQAGETLARVLDPLGQERSRVVAPYDCRVVALRSFSVVWTGDIAFLLAPMKGGN
jgi:predicted deacylase